MTNDILSRPEFRRDGEAINTLVGNKVVSSSPFVVGILAALIDFEPNRTTMCGEHQMKHQILKKTYAFPGFHLVISLGARAI